MWALNIAALINRGQGLLAPAEGATHTCIYTALASGRPYLTCSQPTRLLWWCGEMREKTGCSFIHFEERAKAAAGIREEKRKREAVSTPYRSGAGTQPHGGRSSFAPLSAPRVAFFVCIITNPQLTSTPLILTNSPAFGANRQAFVSFK